MILRLLWFAVLLTLTLGWLERHFEVWGALLAWVTGVGAVFTGLLGWITVSQKQATEAEQRAWRERIIGFFLAERVLLLATILLLFTISFVSSVAVDMKKHDRALGFSIEPVHATTSSPPSTLVEPERVVRQRKLTTPFGRKYVIQMDGYLPHTFEIAPWAGATVLPREHLTPIPTILLRLPHDRTALADDAWIRIEAGGEQMLLAKLDDHASVQLGPGGQSLRSRVPEWRRELLVHDVNPVTAEKIVGAWSRTLKPSKAKAWNLANRTIVAELLPDKTQPRVAHIEFQTNLDALQDHVLELTKGPVP